MNAQQRQKRDRICQDAALLDKYLDGSVLTEEEKKKRVQQLQKNARQRTCRRQDAALLNKYYVDAVTVTDEEEKRYIDWMLCEIRSIGCVTIAT